MVYVQIGVARSGPVWSVKHNGGFLGHVTTRSEALSIARTLADWTAACGRPTEVCIEDAAPVDERPEACCRLIGGPRSGDSDRPSYSIPLTDGG